MGEFRPYRCNNEEVTPQPTISQPSWADLHPELTAKSSGSRVEDLPVVKSYKEDYSEKGPNKPC